MDDFDFEFVGVALEGVAAQWWRRERSPVPEVEAALAELRVARGDEVARALRRGWMHLERSRTASTGDSATHELELARAVFGDLVARDPEGSITTGEGEVDNLDLVVYGHIGNYWYFLWTGDRRNAAIEAYACGETAPLVAMKVFPEELFSRPYAEIREQLSDEVGRLDSQLSDDQWDNAVEWTKYAGRRAGQVTAAAGSVALGLLGSIVTPVAGVLGARGAVKVLQEKVARPALDDTRSTSTLLREARAAVVALDSQFVDECTSRKIALADGGEPPALPQPP